MIMNRLLLAVVLGVILGLGIAFAPGSIVSEQKGAVRPSSLAAQGPTGTHAISSFQFPSILVGLVVGAIVAFPVLVLVRNRL